ncbi:hypothetical protein K435DRAFT_841474 [Dendrothele bispora CBS 962.96]|uniref:Uncharacterized protein n=1 Tax=Dendrothele bispora (strain CBS 962.96) TaxID=1314807 RepID=A0A4V4HEB1_DENBC|nr:hypothetical protein K435DRAFT_841474 [Dendrothele bispora CBS 962.96]
MSDPLSPPNYPILPQELCDLIIDIVALGSCDESQYDSNNCLLDLKACALISKGWRRQAAGHLFKSLTLPSLTFTKVDWFEGKREPKPKSNQYPELTTRALDRLQQAIQPGGILSQGSTTLPFVQELTLDFWNLADFFEAVRLLLEQIPFVPNQLQGIVFDHVIATDSFLSYLSPLLLNNNDSIKQISILDVVETSRGPVHKTLPQLRTAVFFNYFPPLPNLEHLFFRQIDMDNRAQTDPDAIGPLLPRPRPRIVTLDICDAFVAHMEENHLFHPEMVCFDLSGMEELRLIHYNYCWDSHASVLTLRTLRRLIVRVLKSPRITKTFFYSPRRDNIHRDVENLPSYAPNLTYIQAHIELDYHRAEQLVLGLPYLKALRFLQVLEIQARAEVTTPRPDSPVSSGDLSSDWDLIKTRLVSLDENLDNLTQSTMSNTLGKIKVAVKNTVGRHMSAFGPYGSRQGLRHDMKIGSNPLVPPSYPTLPQELCDLIIDIVALGSCDESHHDSNNLSDLKACALVSKGWRRQAAGYLFKSLTLPSLTFTKVDWFEGNREPKPDSNRFPELTTTQALNQLQQAVQPGGILSQQSNILPFVQELTLDFWSLADFFEAARPLLEQIPFVPNQLQGCVFDHVITTNSFLSYLSPLLLNNNDSIKQISILEIIMSSHGSVQETSSQNQTMMFFDCFPSLPNLEHLFFRDSEIDSDNHSGPDFTATAPILPRPRPRIVTLDIVDGFSAAVLESFLFQRELFCFDLTGIEELRLIHHNYGWDCHEPVLTLCKTSLRRLTVRILNNPRTLESPFYRPERDNIHRDIENLPSLAPNLTYIQAYIELDYHRAEQFILGLPRLKALCSLQVLEIQAKAEVTTPRSDFPVSSGDSSSSWDLIKTRLVSLDESLDSLTQCTMSNTLGKIKVVVKVKGASFWEAKSFVDSCFTRMKSKSSPTFILSII